MEKINRLWNFDDANGKGRLVIDDKGAKKYINEKEEYLKYYGE